MAFRLCADELADLIGVPWKAGGRDPAVGLDCLGAPLAALRRKVPCRDPWEEIEEARRNEWQFGLGDIRQAPWSGWRQLADDEPSEPGDILGLGLKETPTHMVLLLEDGLCLHAQRLVGVVLTPLRVLSACVRARYRWVG